MERTKLSKELTLEQNKQNQTAFVVVGKIGKVEVEDVLSFTVKAEIPRKQSEVCWVAEKTVAYINHFPVALGHKILQNKGRRVKITIELTDDEDFV